MAKQTKITAKPATSLKEKVKDISIKLNAENFVTKLKSYCSAEELIKIQRYFKSKDEDTFIGVRMGQLFALAKTYINMEPGEIEKLLDNPVHEVRAGAVSIMDFQARSKKFPESRKKVLFELYIRRHDRINNWDLVDRAAPYVVGGYLSDKPRDILYKLARSKNVWERRTSIVSTYYFIRQGDVADTFRIAEILINDEQDLIHKAAGGWLRTAGNKDPEQLLIFLNKYAGVMPRTMLRYAIEHLNEKQKAYYLNVKKTP